MLGPCSENECVACGGKVVGNIKIDYYVVIAGRGYWRPSKKLRKLGFQDDPCGVDGPAAWATAYKWNRKVEEALLSQTTAPTSVIPVSPDQAEAARRYPPGSVGSGFQRYIVTEEWKKKGVGTRNKIWWPAWRRIRDMWGDVSPDSITFEQISEWRVALEKNHGLDVAHKTIKIWRALWNVLLAMKIARGKDPSSAVINNAPQPRYQRWSEGETVRLAKGALRKGFAGLACIIAVAWDSTFSPVDVRTLRKRQLKLGTKGMIFDRIVEGRQKTGRAAIGTVCKRTQKLVTAYLAQRPVELHAEAFLFCTRSNAPYREDTLAHDFAKVREHVFPGDRRRLMDLRRSGAAEVVAGKSEPGALSAKMANSIESSNSLFKAYSPVDLATVRTADEARLRGRRRMRDESE